MPTILLLKDEKQRFGTVDKSLREALPSTPICRVRTASEFRYAFLTHYPEVVILSHPSSSYQATNVAWEALALRPDAKLIVLAQDTSSRDAWQCFGDSVFDVVGESELVGAIEAAARAPSVPAVSTRASVVYAPEPIDTHRLKNRMAGLLAGLHAMAFELRAAASQTARISEIADEYVDGLVDVVGDICAMVAATEVQELSSPRLNDVQNSPR
jgi:hypothetical protein